MSGNGMKRRTRAEELEIASGGTAGDGGAVGMMTMGQGNRALAADKRGATAAPAAASAPAVVAAPVRELPTPILDPSPEEVAAQGSISSSGLDPLDINRVSPSQRVNHPSGKAAYLQGSGMMPRRGRR